MMADSFVDPRPYVAPAAKALDQLWPGWERAVDTEALDMTSCALCVLGQIGYTIHQEGDDYVWMWMYGKAWSFIVANGLCTHVVEGVFSDNMVKEQWINEIDARRLSWQEDLDAARAAVVHA